MLAEAFEEAGLPQGVFNVVTGGGGAVGEPILKHNDVRVVSFTGSTDVGRDISVACAPSFKRLHLEMGGKNVIMVMEDADVDLAVDGSLWGAFGTAGQRCTASSRLVVHEKVYDEFVEKLAKRAKAMKVGDGLDESIDMGPVVSKGQRERSRSTSRSARTRGRSSSRAARSSDERRSREGLLPPADRVRGRQAGRCGSRRRRSSGR